MSDPGPVGEEARLLVAAVRDWVDRTLPAVITTAATALAAALDSLAPPPPTPPAGPAAPPPAGPVEIPVD